MIFGAFRKGTGRPLRVFGAIWFLVAFLPISNVLELNATAAEHWLYLPLVGMLLVFFGWMVELPARAFRIATAATICAAAALGVRSHIRSADWLTAQGFYEQTIAAGGWSPRVGLNLAVVYSAQNRLDEAKRLLEKTLVGWPEYPLARTHLAIVLAKQGAAQAADKIITENAEIAARQQFTFPRTWAACMQLARREMDHNRSEEALRVLAATRAAHPHIWPVAEMEVEILRRTRGPEVAMPIVQQFTDRTWWQYPAFVALGKLKAQAGDADGAIAALRHASLLDIRETEALNLITRIELNKGNLEMAFAAQKRAVSRQPDRPSQHVLFSEVLTQMGRTKQAQQALDRAKSLQEQGGSA
jgi:tetratricopeptide (TPR) repeat protein